MWWGFKRLKGDLYGGNWVRGRRLGSKVGQVKKGNGET